MKKVFITGISGQDGIILTSKLLRLNENITVIGTSRHPDLELFKQKLNIFLNSKKPINLKILNIDFSDNIQIENIFQNYQPDTVFNLMGPSNVNDSIGNEDYYHKNIYLSFENLVSSLKTIDKEVKFFQASSSEMFGISNKPLSENSNLEPRNPYAIAKYKVKNSIDNKYFDCENITFIEGIMFNHESELRSNKFLIMKIIDDVIKIHKNKLKKTTVGSLEYIRDWSYAGDIMDAVIKMTNLENSKSYVLGSGVGTSIEKILELAFNEFNLDWNKFVDVDERLLRKGDPLTIVSDPSKIQNELSWAPMYSIEDIIYKLMKHKIDYESDK